MENQLIMEVEGEPAPLSVKVKNCAGHRPKDPIRAFFKEVETGEKNKKIQKCRKCETPVSNRPDRMRSHLDKCNKGIPEPGNGETTGAPSRGSGNSAGLSQNKVGKYVVKTSAKEKEELDLLVAKFFYSCNIQFAAANDKDWLKLVSKLRPGYTPPKRETLATTLLDKVYEELHNKMKTKVEGKEVCIAQDGWSDVHNSPILSHTMVVEGKSFLLNAVECGSSTKDAKYCAEQLEKAIEEVKHFGGNPVCAVTDNCPTMVSMRGLMSDKFPEILFNGCSSHMLNCLSKDVSPQAQVNNIVEVNKFFRNTHKPAELLKEKGGVKPQIPCQTRWMSHKECVQTFVNNRAKYIEICQIPGIGTPTITKMVNNLTTFKAAEDLLVVLNQIADAINCCQKDNATVADALHVWLKLSKLPALRKFQAKLKERMDCCTADFFYSAYLLHPVYKGELMENDMKDKALKYLLDLSEDFVVMATRFLQDDTETIGSVWLNDSIRRKLHPINWWTQVCSRNTAPAGFLDFVKKMFACRPSSASVERAFSTFGFVQSNVRNRLRPQTVLKLSFIYRYIRLERDLPGEAEEADEF